MVVYHGSMSEEACRGIAKTGVLNPSGKSRGMDGAELSSFAIGWRSR